MHGLLAEMARRFGERNFVTDGAQHLSYAEFQRETIRVARGLHALGVRRGDKVALLTAGSSEGCFVIAAGAGASVDLKAVGAEVAAALSGRGGGSDRIYQGKCQAVTGRAKAFAVLRAARIG